MVSDSLRIDISELKGPGGGTPVDRPGGPDEEARRGGVVRRLLRLGSLLVLLAFLPFFTLVRASVFLFEAHGFGCWSSLAAGAGTTVLLLVLYLVAVSLKLGGKGRVPKSLLKGTGILVAAYCLFTLLYISGGNVKTAEIRDTYTSLNPILRVGVSTLLLVDREGVLTATGRTLEDYAAWGLPQNQASLHLPQEDGYVYAVDVRTVGRPEWRNGLVRLYFRAMGFGTLRHFGTADHLHVSLQPPT